jgi:FkbM family methyltransferase
MLNLANVKDDYMNDRDSDLLAKLSDRLKRLENLVGEIRSLVGPFGALFPDGTMLVQTIHGLKYFIDPSDEIMAPQLVVYRQWEPDLSSFILNSVTSDTVFVDIGANFGYFTCLAASKIGTQGAGKVISIEPNPAMQRLLRKNTRINWSLGAVEIHNCAVTERTGFVEFVVPSGRAANASVANTPAAHDDGRFIVPSQTLDELLQGLTVDLIKVDVEGFETAVLRGASNTLRRSTAVQIVLEWSLAQMKTAGFLASDLLKVLADQQFIAYHIPPSRFISDANWLPLKIDTNVLQETTYENILLRRGP